MTTPNPNDLMKAIAAEVAGQRYPPVHLWEPDFCGDIDMRIAADGTWFYMGTPITRERMVRLFSSVLRKDADDKTYLITPIEKIGITVDDAHFTVILAEQHAGDDGPVIHMTTNVGDQFFVDDDHELWVVIDEKTQEPRPYVRVRGNLTALISRTVFYQLVDWATLGADGALVLQSGACRYALGNAEGRSGS